MCKCMCWLGLHVGKYLNLQHMYVQFNLQGARQTSLQRKWVILSSKHECTSMIRARNIKHMLDRIRRKA